MNFLAAKAFLLNIFDSQLDKTLFYHSKTHTLDVIRVSENLCKIENISDEATLLVKTAALFHDSGFLKTYANHEAASCQVAAELLPLFFYDAQNIDTICQLIMATKIPQSPTSHLAQILCDADLDYLGRPDNAPIAQTLFLELKQRDLVKSMEEWNDIQIKFLGKHHYFTDTNQRLREPVKQAYLSELVAQKKILEK